MDPPCKSQNANMFRSHIHTVRTETNTDIKSAARDLSKQPGNRIKYLQIFSSVMTKLKDNADCGDCFNSCKPETFAGRLTTTNLRRRDAGNGSQEEIRMPAHPPAILSTRVVPCPLQSKITRHLSSSTQLILYYAWQAKLVKTTQAAQLRVSPQEHAKPSMPLNNATAC